MAASLLTLLLNMIRATVGYKALLFREKINAKLRTIVEASGIQDPDMVAEKLSY